MDLARDGRVLGRLEDIERVCWVSVADWRAPATRSEVEIPLPGGPRSFSSYHVLGEHAWGLTHRILERFLEVYPHGALGGGTAAQ